MTSNSARRRPLGHRRSGIALASAGALVAAVLLSPTQSAAAGAASAPSLSTIQPGSHPVLQVPTKVNLVFVGYQPSAINLPHLLAGLPTTGDPIVRYPANFGIHQDLGLRYTYHYVPRFAGAAFDDAFFGYLSTAGFVGGIGPVVDHYNHQVHHSLTVGPQVRYIDAASTEAWLEQNALSRLGIARGQDTVFLVNWYGRADFQFHEYTNLDYTDPDTGITPGDDYFATSRAWGGQTGPSWFFDLSADPNYWDNSWDVDTADFDNNGQIEYRLPAIWDYGNTSAYRPFTDLSGDLAIAVRYVAVDTMFGASPIYDPAVTVPPPGGAKQVAFDIFEGDPTSNGLSDVHPDLVRSYHQALEPYYPIDVTVHDQPLNDDVRRALYIAGSFRPPPDCWNQYGDQFAEIYCYFAAHRTQYFPAAGENAVIPAVGFTLHKAPVTYNFFGSTDPDWTTGRPAIIEILDTPPIRNSIYAVGYTSDLTHEVGHFVGLSHRHDGYDSTTGIDFDTEGPTDVAWMGDESATVMSYLPGAHAFDVFDIDNLARWQVVRLLDLADTDAAAVLAHHPNAHANQLLTQADAQFAHGLTAIGHGQWVAAATDAVAGYRDVQLADAAVGVTPSSQRLAAAQAAMLASSPASVLGDDARDPLTDPTRPLPSNLPAPASITALPPAKH